MKKIIAIAAIVLSFGVGSAVAVQHTAEAGNSLHAGNSLK